MGIVQFALKGNYKRFYNELKKISKTNHKAPIIMFFDAAFSTITIGSGLQDYLNYRFYEKKHKERKEYITIGSMNKAYQTLANIKYSDFMSNKSNFHENYHKYMKREYLSNEATYEEFLEFIKNNKEFIRKPLKGLGGGRVEKVCVKDIKDLKSFYEELSKDGCFIEELIIQDQEWGRICPKSINTLRLMTFANKGKSRIFFGAARIGNGSNIADNFHQGGMGVIIDLEKGELIGKGINKDLEEFDASITGVKLDGLKIPYWEEIKAMVLEAALVNDNINVVGWDIAISNKGPLIIEGNRGPGFDLVQVLLKKGTKYMLDECLNEVNNTKKLS